MEAFEERIMKELEALKFVRDKVEGINAISSQLDALDKRMEEQTGRIDAVQAKVNLTMNSLTDVRQDQVVAARVAKSAASPSSPGAAGQEGIIQSPPPRPPPPPLQIPRPATFPYQPDTARGDMQRLLAAAGCLR